jgi:hypothetical protein
MICPDCSQNRAGISASLVADVLLGFLLLSHVGHWLSAAPGAGQ